MSSDIQHENPWPDPSQMTEAQYEDYMADPHAFHPDHHGAGEHGHEGEDHHVTSVFLLRAVLAVLIFFTILTVAASRGEMWIANVFGLEIPGLVNVFIAMSIATIKATFVVSIFMHLKWDSRLNLLVFMFTLMGVGLFIGLTAMDLGNRTELYDWTNKQIHVGGSGSLGVTLTRGEDETIGISMVEYARNKGIQEMGESAYEEELALHHAHTAPEPMRTPDRSRVMQGRTAGLFSLEAPVADHSAAGHGEHAESRGEEDGAEHAAGDAHAPEPGQDH